MKNEYTIVANKVNVATIAKVLIPCVATSKSNSHFVPLSGINIQVKDGKYTATATDGLVMQVMGERLDKKYPSFIVPAKAIKDLKAKGIKVCDFCLGDDGIIDFVVNTEVVLQAKAIEGPYPNYNICIPTYYDHTTAFKLSDFNNALDKVKNLALASHLNKVGLSFYNDYFKVETYPLFVEEGIDEELLKPVKVPCVSDWDGGIRFNFKLVKKILKRFAGCSEIFLKTNNPVSATLWCSNDGDGNSWTTLLMPLRG